MIFVRNLFIFIAVSAFLFIIFWPSYIFSKLENGRDYEYVVSVLGDPKSRREYVDVCNLNILTKSDCENVYSSGAVMIHYWNVGIDTWIVAGFDDRKKLVFKLMTDS